MKILVAGYPYIREYYLKTFDQYPEKDQLFFLLPKKWKAKRGQVIFNPPSRDNILITRAYFYHSNYPILGGLLKGWMPALPLYIHRVFKKEKGILYSPSEPILLTTLYQGIWAKIFGLKHVIFTWENVDYEKKFSGLNWLVKKIILRLNLKLCDGIVCGNKKAKDIFSKWTTKPIGVIPISGLDPKVFKPRENLKTGDKITFSFIGALGHRKGVHLILRAFRDLFVKIPNAHLMIVGSGEDKSYEDRLNDMIKELGIRDSVTKIPWVNHKKLLEILSESDVFLYPSISYKGWEEQFGYSIAEAGLMKVPVISTRSGSIDEVVVDCKTGILVQQDNEGELLNAMMLLGNSEQLRKELGENARKYIIENFSNEIVAEKFYRFFRTAIS